MKIMLDEGAKLPTRAHEDDAGLDLYCREDVTIYPIGRKDVTGVFANGQYRLAYFDIPNSVSIDTGVHMEIPNGYFGHIESKSGLNVKQGIVSCGGIIDSGYTGSIVVKLYNFGTEPYTFHAGDKISQIIIQPYIAPELELVDVLDVTERADSGFGSTGK